MMDGALIPWLLAGIPVLGLLAGLPLRSDPERLKWSCVAWAVISFGSVVACAGRISLPPEGLLPLYLLTAEPDAAAVAFAQVRAGRMSYVGLARDADLLPGIKAHADSRYSRDHPQWPDLVAAWRTDLERIAREHAGGIATVDPKRYPQTCQYCDLQSLCRIRERLGEPVIEEAKLQEPGE